MKTDIIFVSDIRLNSQVQHAAINDIKKRFALKGYNFYHNSTGASRGVGILISKKLNCSILNERRDLIGNFLILLVDIQGFEMVIGSIYGPNDENLDFFNDLEQTVQQLGDKPRILGGDWNLTWDNRAVNQNIDVLNMRDIPSKRKSDRIRILADDLDMTDPYRFFYPNRREYTYVPSAQAANNRSRLDFFLVSRAIIHAAQSCSTPHSLLSTTFDHKPVFLSFKPSRIINRNTISNQILNDPDIEIVVRCAVVECHVQHAVPCPALDDGEKMLVLSIVGRILGALKIKHETMLENLTRGEPPNQGHEELNRLVLDQFFLLPGIDLLETLPKNCTADIFFEALSSCIKTECLAFQSRFFEQKKIRKKTLLERISTLKLDFYNNRAEIIEAERELTNLQESDLRFELEKLKNFERLQNEKITPYFLKMARCTQTEVNLDVVIPPDPNQEREEYIVDYFQQTYALDNTIVVNENSIPDFLGNVNENPTVQSAKLTEAEKTILERDLSLRELDTALRGSKTKSAPGIDGIGYDFIRKFWQFLRLPILNYANYCYDNGRLTDSFRTAKIRLIPKKGDLANLKNWRPISLLSCFYKLLSRAIANRLRRYMDKLTPFGQKGFSETRQCQEPLINLTDVIKKCNAENRKACVLSLDISKAFDSISHHYLEQVLLFYNFGPRYIRWIKLIATNRLACIIKGNGTVSRNFPLQRGNAQGDVISPFLFNLCFQIFIFKIECDVQVHGIVAELEPVDRVPAGVAEQPLQVEGEAVCVQVRAEAPPVLPGQPPPPDPEPQHQQLQYAAQNQVENNFIYAKKIFAYADDGTLLLKLEYNTLNRVKNILSDFANISGLKCNIDKTFLMQIGSMDEIDPNILGLGFGITNEITVLGMKFCGGNGDFITVNADKMIEKIQKQVTFWERFNLSLPGRINVAKSLMYSQLNYLGCFLPVSEEKTTEINEIIGTFVKGNLRISKKRIFMRPEDGGLGLFEVKQFLRAQICSWIRRADNNIDDYWKHRLWLATSGDIFYCDINSFCEIKSPVLYNIIKCYNEWVPFFWKFNENFREARIIDNELLSLQRNSNIKVSLEFFQDYLPGHKVTICRLTLRNVHNGNRFVSLEEFEAATGIPISQRKLTALRGVFETAEIRLKKHSTAQQTSIKLPDFIRGIKRGCKKFRKIEQGTLDSIPHNIVKFTENTEIVLDLTGSKTLNGSWNISYLENDLRVFIFKLHNNTLGYNNMVARFVANIEPFCTFCTIGMNPDLEPETALHIFYACPYTEPLLNIFNEIRRNNDVTRRIDLFFKFNDPSENNVKVLFLTAFMYKKYIWDCKLRKCLPDYAELKEYIKTEIRCIKNISTKFRSFLDGSDYGWFFL